MQVYKAYCWNSNNNNSCKSDASVSCFTFRGPQWVCFQSSSVSPTHAQWLPWWHEERCTDRQGSSRTSGTESPCVPGPTTGGHVDKLCDIIKAQEATAFLFLVCDDACTWSIIHCLIWVLLETVQWLLFGQMLRDVMWLSSVLLSWVGGITCLL